MVAVFQKVADGSERKFAVTESKFLPRCQNPQFCGFVPRGNLLGSAFPKPCYGGLRRKRFPFGRPFLRELPRKYLTDQPIFVISERRFTAHAEAIQHAHRSRVVKTRLSEDEYADFTARLAPYGISQSEFLRQAIRRTAIRPIIHVSAVNDELLSAVGNSQPSTAGSAATSTRLPGI